MQDICDVYDGKTTNLHEIVGDSFPADSGIGFRGAGEKSEYFEIEMIGTILKWQCLPLPLSGYVRIWNIDYFSIQHSLCSPFITQNLHC